MVMENMAERNLPRHVMWRKRRHDSVVGQSGPSSHQTGDDALEQVRDREGGPKLAARPPHVQRSGHQMDGAPRTTRRETLRHPVPTRVTKRKRVND